MRQIGILTLSILAVTSASHAALGQAGNRDGQKGMDVVADAAPGPCSQPDQVPRQPSGAKSLFFDPSSGVALTGSSKVTRPGQPASKPMGQPAAAAAPVEANTGLRYWIELVQSDGQMKRVARTRTFRNGEKIRFHFESNVDGYLAMVLTDSTGATKTLFPTSAVRNGNNAMERGKDYVLPSADAWFKFDQSPGQEHLTIVFSKSRDAIDQLQVRPDMDARTVARVMDVAREGSKGIDVEVDEAANNENQPAAYFVRKSPEPGSFVAMEICLTHAP